jgi:hypothetical protein
MIKRREENDGSASVETPQADEASMNPSLSLPERAGTTAAATNPLTRPGACRVRDGSRCSSSSSNGFLLQQPSSVSRNDNSNPQRASQEEQVIEAHLVIEDPPRELVIGTPVPMEPTPNSRRRLLIVATALTLLGTSVAVGIYLVIRLGREGGSPSSPAPSSQAPTPAPGTPSTALSEALLSFLPAFSVKAITEDDSSCQSTAFQWATSTAEEPYYQQGGTERLARRFALATLFCSTQGPAYWTEKAGWMGDAASECEWDRVECRNNYGQPPDAGQLSNYVAKIVLTANGLVGTIAPELALLTSLRELTLDINELELSIPTQLGALSKLEVLSLRYIHVSGPIPTELGQLSSVKELYLYGNQLNGTIPTELGSLKSLEYLGVFENELTGIVPSVLCHLGTQLELDCLEVDCSPCNDTCTCRDPT